MYYTINNAIKSKLFENIIVSTNSEKILKKAKYYGADAWFIRPKKLSLDKSQKVPVIKHALIEAEKYYNKKFEVIIDLTQDKEIIHSNLRKSYKSLINQGEREIDFITINKENPDREQFEAYRSFHKKVSGRTTRTVNSWEAQFQMIEIGCAELIMGKMEPYGLVSSTFCNDLGDTTFYGAEVQNHI